jgi:hypothetical protein
MPSYFANLIAALANDSADELPSEYEIDECRVGYLIPGSCTQ